MDHVPALSSHLLGPANAAVCARLATIEERLDEIIGRLDELKNLVTRLDCGQPNLQNTIND